MAKGKQTSESIDIMNAMEGKISDVIERLTELQKQHPDGTIHVGTYMEYGETYAEAELTYYRDKTPLELEAEVIAEKAALLERMRKEYAAFVSNDAEYPKLHEMNALREELGYLALAPMRGIIQIYDGEIVVSDMLSGIRRKDGTYVARVLTMLDEKHQKLQEESIKDYLGL